MVWVQKSPLLKHEKTHVLCNRAGKPSELQSLLTSRSLFSMSWKIYPKKRKRNKVKQKGKSIEKEKKNKGKRNKKNEKKKKN